MTIDRRLHCWIIKLADQDDERQLCVLFWGGGNTLP